MKILLFTCIAVLGVSLNVFAQSTIVWSDNTNIALQDLKGEPAEDVANDEMQSYYLATTLAFAYNMNGYVFAFKKNFNKYVTTQYYPNDSWLETGESSELLLELLNLEFDIVELFARRYRKRLFTAKNILSSSNFFVDEYNVIQKEYNDYSNNLNKEISEKNEDELAVYIQKKAKEVNDEIAELHEYCKSCKPLKKRK